MRPWQVRAGKLVIKHGPKALPIVAAPAKLASQRLANREKAISHSRRVGGRFGEVWIGSDRYWVVEKNGEILNCFPTFNGDESKLRKALDDLRDGELRTHADLMRARIRAIRPRRKRA